MSSLKDTLLPVKETLRFMYRINRFMGDINMVLKTPGFKLIWRIFEKKAKKLKMKSQEPTNVVFV